MLNTSSLTYCRAPIMFLSMAKFSAQENQWPQTLHWQTKTTLWGTSPPFPLFHMSHCFLASLDLAALLALPSPKHFAYQSLPLLHHRPTYPHDPKSSAFLPVVSSTASVFVKTLQQLLVSCQVSQRLIKLSRSVIRHARKKKGWGCVCVCVWEGGGVLMPVRTGSAEPYWPRKGEGLRLFCCLINVAW